MKGCKPLTDEETQKIVSFFRGEYKLRNQLLVVFGITTGFRISEILSLTVKDVFQNGKIVGKVSIAKRNMKGETESRSALLRPETQKMLLERIAEIGNNPGNFIFQARQGENKAIDRTRAWQIIQEAKVCKHIDGKVGTHCMRKTYANKMYDALGKDLVRLQKALGHQYVNTTAQYISFREEDIDEAVSNLTFGVSA